MQLKTRCIPNAEQLSYVCRIVQSSIVSNKEKKKRNGNKLYNQTGELTVIHSPMEIYT